MMYDSHPKYGLASTSMKNFDKISKQKQKSGSLFSLPIIGGLCFGKQGSLKYKREKMKEVTDLYLQASYPSR